MPGKGIANDLVSPARHGSAFPCFTIRFTGMRVLNKTHNATKVARNVKCLAVPLPIGKCVAICYSIPLSLYVGKTVLVLSHLCQMEPQLVL